MEHSWLIEKVLTGLIVFAAVAFAVLRLGGGLAAVAGLGQFPMSMIPARLRPFLLWRTKRPRAQTAQLNHQRGERLPWQGVELVWVVELPSQRFYQ